MGQRPEWIPPSAPLSEGYWQALLRDGEGATAAPSVSPADIWDEPDRELVEPAEEPASSGLPENPWERARELKARGETLELPVVGCDGRGLIVAWNGLRGFVPASRLREVSPSESGDSLQDDLQRLVGTRLCVRIIEVDPALQRLVLSERATQGGNRQGRRLLSELEPGDVVQGRVTNLCSFGAFVDLGGFEGLVHISELSWGRVGHPSDVLRPDQIVDVYVLNVEPERERVGLSIKRLQPNPWESVEERYDVGQIVKGEVTHVVDFGAFVRVEDGLEGLIHVSELGADRGLDPHDVLRPGDAVAIEILNLDASRRRMGLRLDKRAIGDDEVTSGDGPPSPGEA